MPKNKTKYDRYEDKEFQTEYCFVIVNEGKVLATGKGGGIWNSFQEAEKYVKSCCYYKGKPEIMRVYI